MNLSRTFVVAGCVLVLPLALGFARIAPRPAAPSADPPRLEVRGVIGVATTVVDLDAATAWYRDVLECVAVAEREEAGDAVERRYGVFPARVRAASLRLGAERLELEQFLAPEGRPHPRGRQGADADFQHLAIVVRDMGRAYARLRAARVAHHSPGPQRLPDRLPAAGGIEAFYFRDLDGHPLELIAFPPDKGADRWRAPSPRLFLGVDHTAITVRTTEAALAFYEGALGARVAGRSLNDGVEQARLNAVRGARVAITGLVAPAGPGVELLDYLAPDDGREADPELRTCDVVCRRTIFAVDDADVAAAALRALGAPLVSDGAVDAVDPEGVAIRSVLARDPDGHMVEFRATTPAPARHGGGRGGIQGGR
ncbi:MAG TPA: VOC family protein [Planctomycetota bacterium]|nr:VOC family protein [Planctomycetota bacterium]